MEKKRTVAELCSLVGGELTGPGHTLFSRLAYDSRILAETSDTLFIALKGSNHDGHRYIPELYDRGVRAFLVSEIAGGFVRGMVGDDPTYLKSVPCAKHYFANNSEFDRHVSSSDMDSRDMREFYLSPYKKLIEEDNLPSIMSSYNAVNGVPTSASKYYLDTIARRTYGLDGYITGDCAAIEDIYTGHYYVETAEEATAEGLKAGVDCDCGNVYQRSTISALNQGLVSMADVDKALVNIFTIRMRTGEFDPPAKVPYAQYQTGMVNSPANRSLAYEIATKTPVLLKNDAVADSDKKALPLHPATLKKIALIGPHHLMPDRSSPFLPHTIPRSATTEPEIKNAGPKNISTLKIDGCNSFSG